MLLNNVTCIGEESPVSLLIRDGHIWAKKTKPVKSEWGGPAIDCSNAIAFPGLINSHDHLDFNCFSPLGQEKYDNYTSWGNDIHQRFQKEISAVLKIPASLRTQWGIYKNLLAGVTTVVNHGARLQTLCPLIHVYQEPQSLHSVRLEQKWKWKLNNPLHKFRYCVIHTGEGSDLSSREEINKLVHWNLLRRKLVGVHAVAMQARQAKHFSAVVWCPESNAVLLNSHANIALLKQHSKIVFGTDSTLTGHWNIWQHLRLARTLQQTTDAELYAMTTANPAGLWRLARGSILPGNDADMVIAENANHRSTWDNFFATDPGRILLVIQQGRIRLFDSCLLEQLRAHITIARFSSVVLQGKTKMVAGNLPGLIKKIRHYHPGINFPTDIIETGKLAADA